MARSPLSLLGPRANWCLASYVYHRRYSVHELAASPLDHRSPSEAIRCHPDAMNYLLAGTAMIVSAG